MILTDRPTHPLQALSEYVARVKAEKNLSLPDIKRRGGPSLAWVNAIENLTTTDTPKPATLRKLAKGLGVPEQEVFKAAGIVENITDKVSIFRSIIGDHAKWVSANMGTEPITSEQLDHIASFVMGRYSIDASEGRSHESNMIAALHKEFPDLFPTPRITVLTDLGELAYPPSPEERAIMAEAERLGFQFACFSEPGFWETAPGDLRRRMFRGIEDTIESYKAVRKAGGK